jgi:hypothetical protein
VARATLKRLAEQLGLNETQVVHLALKDLAARELPRYAPDDGLPAKSQLRVIQKAAGGWRLARQVGLLIAVLTSEPIWRPQSQAGDILWCLFPEVTQREPARRKPKSSNGCVKHCK